MGRFPVLAAVSFFFSLVLFLLRARLGLGGHVCTFPTTAVAPCLTGAIGGLEGMGEVFAGCKLPVIGDGADRIRARARARRLTDC